jgi:hypothetical protein
VTGQRKKTIKQEAVTGWDVQSPEKHWKASQRNVTETNIICHAYIIMGSCNQQLVPEVPRLNRYADNLTTAIIKSLLYIELLKLIIFLYFKKQMERYQKTVELVVILCAWCKYEDLSLKWLLHSCRAEVTITYDKLQDSVAWSATEIKLHVSISHSQPRCIGVICFFNTMLKFLTRFFRL